MIPEVYDHASDGSPGAFSIAGAKYSSARGVAERTTNMVARRIGKRVAPSRTATTLLPGAGIADHEALTIERCRATGVELSIAEIRHLIARYGERAADIVSLLHERPDSRAPLAVGEPTFKAEVLHVIRQEMAVRLSDIILRRTTCGSTGYPGDEVIHSSASLAAAELGWDQKRTADETEDVKDFYVMG
jgi:glycerol-3-phosphate dehydrogenase